jgi:hypothetical protein
VDAREQAEAMTLRELATWLRASLVAALASGCGRIAFDPRDDAQTGYPRDGVPPPARCVPQSDLRISNAAGVSRNPSFAWTGSGVSLLWMDNRSNSWEAMTTRLDENNQVVASEVGIVPLAEFPLLTHMGENVAVVWEDVNVNATDIIATAFDASGQRLAGDVPVLSALGAQQRPGMACTSTECGVAWLDAGGTAISNLYVARWTLAGGDAPKLVATDVHGFDPPAIARADNEYGIAYADGAVTDVFFVRTDLAGNRIDNPINVSMDMNAASPPALVWTGSEYGVAWISTPNLLFNVMFARLASDGTPIGTPIPLRTPTVVGAVIDVTIAWTGAEYDVAWADSRNGSIQIYVSPIRNGVAATEEQSTSSPGRAIRPRLEWTGAGLMMAWQDDRDGNDEIYFASYCP